MPQNNIEKILLKERRVVQGIEGKSENYVCGSVWEKQNVRYSNIHSYNSIINGRWIMSRRWELWRFRVRFFHGNGCRCLSPCEEVPHSSAQSELKEINEANYWKHIVRGQFTSLALSISSGTLLWMKSKSNSNSFTIGSHSSCKRLCFCFCNDCTDLLTIFYFVIKYLLRLSECFSQTHVANTYNILTNFRIVSSFLRSSLEIGSFPALKSFT